MGDMHFDFGHGLVQMFEQRFGRRTTSALLLLIAAAVVVFCLQIIVSVGVIPVFRLVRDALPNAELPAINVITALYVAGALALAALLAPTVRYLLEHRRVPQSVVDELALLRKTAIDDILNGSVQSEADLKAWEQSEEDWEQSVSNTLRKHFPEAEALGFESLGVIQPVNFPHAFNNEHSFELGKFAKRLSILEDIIRRHTR